ncbi:hypothetical protein PRIPAC_89059 [Pristionchus pacificus]|uniref:Uncharacterized protein n=1 Tax=Pristionchus pacificus TaxID=54126 RepID=A0A2A6CXM7_PRIPA|nr:hypothetical protein PRIPAC_89059 [Pristionchus pacificus]|eukprot:PDM82783.1 hypothetical protein PRIPAC_37176 [Pristionchus pacificus]
MPDPTLPSSLKRSLILKLPHYSFVPRAQPQRIQRQGLPARFKSSRSRVELPYRFDHRSAVSEIVYLASRTTAPALQMSAFWNMDSQHAASGMHNCIMMHNERASCGGSVGLSHSPRYSFSLADFGNSQNSSKDSILAFNQISVIGTSPCSSSSFLSKMDSTSSSSSSVSSPTSDNGPVKFFIGTHPKC